MLPDLGVINEDTVGGLKSLTLENSAFNKLKKLTCIKYNHEKSQLNIDSNISY